MRTPARLPLVAAAAVRSLSRSPCSCPGPPAARAADTGDAPRARAAPAAGGTTSLVTFRSPTLGRYLDYLLYLPAGYAGSSMRYPVVYLLHGWGETMYAWTTIQADLDSLIATGQIPPTIFVMPDAPFSSRGSYYVDSGFIGNATLPPGEMVETALTFDLVNHVDATNRTIAGRDGRAIAGFSMGGYGAMRYLLARSNVFRAGIVLSPSVYNPLPPAGALPRQNGGFGSGSAVFDNQIYIQKNYTSTFPIFAGKNLPAAMFIAAGDDEPIGPPAEWTHDLDMEAHVLYSHARRVYNLSTELRVYNGGHTWDVRRPGLIEGLQYAFRFLTHPSARVYLPLVGVDMAGAAP